MATSSTSLVSGLSSNTSSTTNTTGLGQGIDVNSFVTSALAFDQATITNLQTNQANIGQQSSALAAINSNLNALKSAANALNDPFGVFSSEIATSSNSNQLTATADSTGVAGTHSIVVTSLATTSSLYSGAVATGATALATGDTIAISAGGSQISSVAVGATNNTLAQIAAVINSQAATFQSDSVASGSTLLKTGDSFTVSAGGSAVASITVDSTNNTLAQIATAINLQTTAVNATVVTDANGAHLSIANTSSAAPANVSVSGNLHQTDGTAVNFTQHVSLNASVIQDANGARLAVVSTSSGAPGNLTLTGNLHAADNSALGFTQIPGLNAVLSVDGVPISSATNSVSGAIGGVTLNLTAPTQGGPVSLTVGPNTSNITNAISNFVSAYNTAISSINAQFQVNSDGSGVNVLEGDASVRDAQSALLGAISYSVNGSGGPVNLTNLGIDTNNDGTLSIDSNALASALSSNFSGVQSFLQTASTGFAGNLGSVIDNLSGPGGSLALDATGYTNSSLGLTQQILNLSAALATKRQNLVQIYAQVNTTLEELPLLQQQLSQQLASIPK
ncbi:MAG: flagellar filament capping protein FliD [Acidobacteriia bacterium]|nr:flagellar filament capping protein FliD [Terriglobia bacterium]